MALIGRAILKISADTTEIVSNTNIANKHLKKLSFTAKNAANSLRKLESVAMGYLGALGLGQLSNYADSFTNINNRIRLVTSSESELIAIRKQLLAVSNDARVDLDATSDLYRRMEQATEKLGFSQKELLGVTQTISKSLAISGGSAESAKAALVQLSQGFASGVLRGQELNSVMEQTPRLAKAIANGLGLSIGELRATAEQGGLTTLKVIEALKSQANVINEEFLKTDATIEQSFTVLKNNVTELVGEMDKEIGASRSIGEAIRNLSVFMLENKDIIKTTAEHLAKLGMAYGALKLVSATGATRALANAMRDAALASAISGEKLGFFGRNANRAKALTDLLSMKLRSLGTVLRTLGRASLPLLALTAAMEAYSYITGKAAEKQNKLTHAVELTVSEIKKLNAIQAKAELIKAQEALRLQREKNAELAHERDLILAKYGYNSDELALINAQRDAEAKKTRQIVNNINALRDVVHNQNAATAAAGDTAINAHAIAVETYKAVSAAAQLHSALSGAKVAYEKELVRAELLAGNITKAAYAQKVANIETNATSSAMGALMQKYEALANSKKKGAEYEKELNKLNVEAFNISTRKLRIQNDLKDKIKSLKTEEIKTAKAVGLAKVKGIKKAAAAKKIAYNAEKRHTKAITNTNTALNEQKSLQKQIADLKANWFTFGKDEVAEAKKKLELAEKQVATTKAIKGYDRAKYEKTVNEQLKARLAYLQAEHKQLEATYNIYKGGIDSIFKGDIKGGLTSMLDGFGEMLMKPMKESIASYLTELTSSLGGSSLGTLGSGAIGLGLSLIPTLLGSLGHTLTEKELKDAKGRTDFSDESLSKLSTLFENVVNKDLPYTKKMTEYLASIDKNFYKIGSNIAGSDFAIANNNYTASGSSFLGWGSTRSKVGSGIYLDNIDFGKGTAQGSQYLTEQVDESSWFGLSHDQYIKETKKALGNATQQNINQAIKSGKQMIIESARVLGYNVEEALAKVKVSLGKINLDGMSSEEIAKVMQNAMGEVFSKAINELGDINYLVDRYAKAGEQHLETLGRIAMNYEQASDLLKRINFKFSGVDFDAKTILVPFKKQITEVRQVSKFIRGSFADAEYAGAKFTFGGYYTTVTEKINKTVTGYKKVLYTAQMAVLDIVEASGGMDKFSSNYNSFVQNYYSKAEQKAMLEGQLKDSFNGLNITIPKTKAQLRQMIETYKVMGKEGAKTYAELLRLSDSFSSLADMEKQLADNRVNEARKYRDLITDLYLGQYSPLKMAQKELLAMKAVNNTTGTDWEESSKRALEVSYNNATSTQDYRSAFNSYLQALNTNAPKATMDDLAEKLDKQNDILEEQKKTQDRELEIANNNIKELQKIVDTLSKANQQQRVG